MNVIKPHAFSLLAAVATLAIASYSLHGRSAGFVAGSYISSDASWVTPFNLNAEHASVQQTSVR
ncbi:MAG: hypothetical protein ACT4QA_15530 [Panacagrimonas sp.]